MVVLTSLIPAMSEGWGDMWSGSSWFVLGVFWIGLGMTAFYVWRRDYPGGKELIGRIAGEEESETEEGGEE